MDISKQNGMFQNQLQLSEIDMEPELNITAQNRSIYWAMLSLSDRERAVIEYHYSICFADFEQGVPEPAIQDLIKESRELTETAFCFGISEIRVKQIIDKFLYPWHQAAKRKHHCRIMRKYRTRLRREE